MNRRAPSRIVVFIVEDDASMRRALGNLFQSVGLEVGLFGSAPEMLHSKLPDVAGCLVVDLRLPGLSGLDFQTKLAMANIHIPIIFIQPVCCLKRPCSPATSDEPRETTRDQGVMP